MKTLKLLYKKNYLIFHNKYLESPQKKVKLLFLLVALTTLFVGGAYFLSEKLFDPLTMDTPEDAKTVLQTMLFYFMLMFSVFQFFTSAISIVPDFYESPDMQYLITTPIKATTLLIYKLINHSFNVMKKESFFAFPLILASGFLTDAPLIFYMIIPLVYFLVVATSACFGIVLGMFMLSKMTIKRYKTIMTIGQNLFLGLIWIVFVFKWVDFETILNAFSAPFVQNILIYFLPPYSASHIVTDMAFGFSSTFVLNLLVFLLLNIVCIGSAAFVAKRYFFSGWMRQTVVVQPHKKSNKAKLSSKTVHYKSMKNRHPVVCLLYSYWTSAFKNIEFLLPALMMYAMYFGAVFAFIKLSEIDLMIRCIGLMVSGFIFVNLGTSIPLMSSEIIKNPKFEKQQYALFKTFPIKPQHYIGFKLLVQGIPSLVVMTLGMMVAFIFTGVSLLHMVFFIALQSLLFAGYLVQNISFLTLYYQKYYDDNKFVGNLLSLALSGVYYMLTFGLFVLNHFKWFELPFIIIVTIAMMYWLVQLFLILPIGIKAWVKTEF